MLMNFQIQWQKNVRNKLSTDSELTIFEGNLLKITDNCRPFGSL